MEDKEGKDSDGWYQTGFCSVGCIYICVCVCVCGF